MQRFPAFALVAMIAVLGASSVEAAAPPRSDGDPVVDYSAQDAEMNRAIAAARASLSEYLERLDAGQLDDTDSLKVGFPTASGGQEHIWVGTIRRTPNGFTGLLANQPRDMPGYSHGDPVTFTQDMISDWNYQAGGRLWGGYTLRVMLNDIDPRQAAQLRAFLSDTPTER